MNTTYQYLPIILFTLNLMVQGITLFVGNNTKAVKNISEKLDALVNFITKIEVEHKINQKDIEKLQNEIEKIKEHHHELNNRITMLEREPP